ncbi:hypothetical protein SASPL_100190 [Salvia splendens]|uniref:Uncharacterized protein n=1 Tax=Salvia splendens TaxID=180675 RepID=A0A8X8YNQ2_SALSN|nr:hypothetical protein SASPL_100190 [Salvia splendens]
MVSQRMIFLVALLLAVVVGCGRVCDTTKVCPPCKIGEPLCLDGMCTCLDIQGNVKSDDETLCHLDKECPPCNDGKPYCSEGLCTCLPDH